MVCSLQTPSLYRTASRDRSLAVAPLNSTITIEMADVCTMLSSVSTARGWNMPTQNSELNSLIMCVICAAGIYLGE